jgi:hypothetical protein
MSTLTPDDFTQAERDAINFRINIIDQDIAQLQAQVPDPLTKFNAVSVFDEANQRVQDAAIAELITFLHGIITQRDIDEPSEAPHSIKFEPPDPGGQNPSFPINAPELFAADDLPTYLASLPSYTTPFATATLENGAVDVGTPTGGWELWREKTIPPPGREADPDQPVDPELPAAAFNLIKQEFDERNAERLDNDIGSYVLKQFISNQITSVSSQVALLQQRKAFWESIGFPT